jgi:hypothetical protein
MVTHVSDLLGETQSIRLWQVAAGGRLSGVFRRKPPTETPDTKVATDRDARNPPVVECGTERPLTM